MNYCAIQRLLKDSDNSRNVFNTLFYCHKIDSYFEEHHIIEILGELMVRVCIDRPENVVDYLCQKLMEISQKFVRNVVKLEFQNSTKEGAMIIRKLSAQHHIPVIECVNCEMSLNEVYGKLDKYLKSNLFQNRRIIICDFKETERNDKILRVTRNSINRISQKCLSKPHEAIDFQLSDDLFNHQKMNYIYENICKMKPERLVKGNWNCRAMIVGRMGAGRKTQGAHMAKEFGLNLIDLDYLAIQYQQRQSSSGKTNLGFWGFLQETLLKPNCLKTGYVIVSNVISNGDLEILMEKFIYHPNRIIFLHTSERECLRRLLTIEIPQNIANSQDRTIFHKYQMNVYHLNKKEFVEYLRSTKNKILHVNGNKTIHEIKTLISSNLIC